jgi:HlyD family secretion protein
VRLQVDAYPYTQWGMLSGVVEAIGGDLSIQQTAFSRESYFKVLIRPRATHLALPDGTRGELKKGLTLTARYVVGRRSLLQALYDDANVRLNPQGHRPRN